MLYATLKEQKETKIDLVDDDVSTAWNNILPQLCNVEHGRFQHVHAIYLRTMHVGVSYSYGTQTNDDGNQLGELL